jgi:hypothetical protein
MCCTTHDVMDALDRERRGIDVSALLAPSGDFRCQCPFGVPCKRAATEEDLLCARCRGTDHQRWCDENPEAYGGLTVASSSASWRVTPGGYLTADYAAPPLTRPGRILYDEVADFTSAIPDFTPPDPLAAVKSVERYIASLPPGTPLKPVTDLTPAEMRRLLGPSA